MNKMFRNGKEKNNCHYRDCEAITDNLSRISLLSCPTLIGYLSRIKKEFAEILGSCVASPRMTKEAAEILGSKLSFCPRMTFSVLTLATLLSFSIISESWADTCSWSGNIQTCYDANGKKTSERYCTLVDRNGKCLGYSNGYDYTYDQNGNKTSQRYCSGPKHFDNDGNCSSYSNGYDYTYDANGNRTSSRSCNGSNIGNDGKCTSYSSGYDYTYDANRNQTSERYCQGSNIGNDGKCTSYYSRTDWTYDQNGNQTSKRSCNGSNIGNDGKCSNYSSGEDLTYDQNGNQTSYKNCETVDSSGKCTAYSSGTYYTYDAHGNHTSTRYCEGSSNFGNDGNCSSYSSGSDYTYDANGNMTRSVSVNSDEDYFEVYTPSGDSSYGYYSDLTISEDGMLCSSDNPPFCIDMDASHCSINDTDESCLVCKDGYGLKNGNCQYCGSVAQSCHWDDSAGELKADSCVGGYLEKNGSCISSSLGCGDNWKDMGGFCNRIQYTPAEAATVLHDDNTNSVTITFKK